MDNIGLRFMGLNSDSRTKFGIPKSVTGVVVQKETLLQLKLVYLSVVLFYKYPRKTLKADDKENS